LGVGDKAWLDEGNLLTTWPSQKLDWKCIGPYKINKVISHLAYRIQLPSLLGIDNLQPMFGLDKAAQDLLPLQMQEPPPLAIVKGEEVYTGKRVDNSSLFRKQLQYHVI
jgi:hypothetical protein